MLVVQCVQCKQVGFALDHQNPDAAVDCGCCDGAAPGHAVLPDGRPDHRVLVCPTDHTGQPCPAGGDCGVLTPPGEDCPGGHHGLGVDDCKACRPVTVTLPPGQVVMHHAGGEG